MNEWIQRTLQIALLLTSTSVLATDDDYVVFSNVGTIPNGMYKTITYKVCSQKSHSEAFTCSSEVAFDLKDPGKNNLPVAAKVPLQKDQFIFVKRAVEKTVNGAVLAKGEYIAEDETEVTFCNARVHSVAEFGNKQHPSLSTVTCRNVHIAV